MKYLLTIILATIMGCNAITGTEAVFPEPELSLTILASDSLWVAIEGHGEIYHRVDILTTHDTTWTGSWDTPLWIANWCGYIDGKWTRGSDTLSIPCDTLGAA